MFHPLKSRDYDIALGRVSDLVLDGRRIRRCAWCAFALAMALDETVGDAEHRVDNDGVDSFRDLVL